MLSGLGCVMQCSVVQCVSLSVCVCVCVCVLSLLEDQTKGKLKSETNQSWKESCFNLDLAKGG